MRKVFSTIMTVTFSIITLLTATACSNKTGGIVKDENTINVKIHSAGYGVTYAEELKKGFESTYAEEGYKVNILTPDTISNQLIFKEIYADSGIDVYISSADAQESTSYIGQQMFADITDTVIKQKPIGNGKVEGEDTILSYIEDMECDTNFLYDGKYYGLPIALSIGGLGVNRKVLQEEFGVTQLPRTTREFQQIIQTIMVKNANDVANGASYAQVTHPFAYALAGNYYWMSILNTWFYQYSGKQAIDSFWSFENADGTPMTEDAYKVYADEGLELSLSLIYQFYDYNSAMSNVAQDNYLKAQHNVMQGYAVFCPTGDWMFNEEKSVYKNYLNDISFIKVPLVSELGVKLFGAGTNYNFLDDECEELLLKIIDGADANKTVEEIKDSLADTKYANVAEQDILTVCERRGACKDSSGESCYISEKSTKKDIAALFLRYIASTDGAKIWSVEANTTSPYRVGKLEENYEWQKEVNAIFTNRYVSQFSTDVVGYRKRLGVNVMFYGKEHFARKVFDEKKSIYDEDTLRIIPGYDVSQYKIWAKELATAIYEDAKYNVENNVWKLPA